MCPITRGQYNAFEQKITAANRRLRSTCSTRLEREAGKPARAAWALVTEDEAFELLLALAFYFRDERRDPGWHHHVGEGDHELMLAIDPDDVPDRSLGPQQ